MGIEAEESANQVNPQMVGNIFVKQYYTFLSESPEHLHQFYYDDSVVGRPELDGSLSSISTLDEIKNLILSLDYKNCLVEINTVDSQLSTNNGVIVLVTGFFSGKDSKRKKFTQSFFLVLRGASYFVLNDIFRYPDESENKLSNDDDDVSPTVPFISSPDPTPVIDRSVPDYVPDDVPDPLDEGGDHAKEPDSPLENGNIPTIEEEIVADKEVDNTKTDASQVSEPVASSVQEDAPKKSYASVVNALNSKPHPFQQRLPPPKLVKQPLPAAPSVASPRPTSSPRSPSNNAVETNRNRTAGGGHSIFVANLPMDATIDQLVQAFTKFGAIKPDGVQVRSYKQEMNCFGFVEFESADSVEKAVEASTIMIGKRTAHIERKNTERKKVNNVGERYPPRKGRFRDDNNFRSGRGGGRGQGRNDFENQGGFYNQARANNGRNDEASKKVYQNGGARGPRQAQAAKK